MSKESLGPYFLKSNIRDANESFDSIQRFMERGIENLDSHALRSMIGQSTQLTAALNRIMGMVEYTTTK